MLDATRFDTVVAFPAMRVGVRVVGDALTEVAYLPATVRVHAPRNRLAERAARELERYAADPDFEFDLPLAPAGTPFQRRVWREIGAVPRGAARSYAELARVLGSAPRAVGQACGANPYPLIVPCHRVVAARGLGGFAHCVAGFHLEVKRWLLRHERCPLVREASS